MRDGAGDRLVLPARRLAPSALGAGLHRSGRVPDQLDRPDHAVLPGPVPRDQGARHAAALARAAAQDPGGARHPPGRSRLAGDRAGAGREDGQHRGGQGDRQARYAEGVLPAARAGPDRRAHRAGLRTGDAGDDRGDHEAGASRSVARPASSCSQGRRRQGAVPAAGRRTHRDRRDRRAHRPAARPEDHGDRALQGEPRPRRADLPRLRPAGAELDGGLRVHLRLRARHPRGDARPLVRDSGGCSRCWASSSAGPPTRSACG